MTEKNKMIDPADVRELITKYAYDKSTDCESLLDELVHDLHDLLPKPDYPEDMFGMWAEHPFYGRLLVCSARPDADGDVEIAFRNDDEEDGVTLDCIDPSTLSFPEETTRPEDVPVGEAWLVDVADVEESAKNVYAVKHEERYWTTKKVGDTAQYNWLNEEVTLVAPLVPARPVDSEREPESETVTTVEEYMSLPTGSIVAEKECYPVCKRYYDKWESNGTYLSNGDVAGKTRQVLRKGWRE